MLESTVDSDYLVSILVGVKSGQTDITLSSTQFPLEYSYLWASCLP